MSKIDRVEIHAFSFQVNNMSLGGKSAAGVANMVYRAGSQFTANRFAVRILCDDGTQGEYVTHWIGTPSSLGQVQMLAPNLIGRDPEQRELIYDDLKCEIRAYDHMGHGVLDIALWDLAGKKYNTSVTRLLGAYRTRLPTYASTYHGQAEPGGLDTPEAYFDYAQECQEAGFVGFKIHGWNDGNARREAQTVLGVRDAVGPDMYLMVDPACELRTYMDALYVGRACDEANYFWYEDPYRDSGVSALSHQRLREQLRTPLLISEHVRGIEQKANFLLQGGCDMIHADPEYDLGITGALKIARFCEALGLDVQFHACGPAHRAVMAATRNTHFYEMALMGPGMPNAVPPVYTCGYSDQPADLPKDGHVPVPDGPGLGVTYDWDFIEQNRTALFVYE
ncbi:mandelate racemase [Chloroflexi bacterium TSY]|nr:mandelate racemase [Chloroflexi bacterium TSY]